MRGGSRPLPGSADGKDARKDITVEVFDQSHNVVKRYNLINCWPKSVRRGTRRVEGNRVAIETLTIAHEGWEAD